MLGINERRVLAARASTLDERCGGGFLPQKSRASSRVAARRLIAWRQTAAVGDEQLFDHRLASAGLEVRAVASLLGDVVLSPGHSPPPWTSSLGWILEALSSPGQRRSGRDADAGVTESEDPLPFETLFAPVVAAAVQRRDLLLKKDAELLTASAHRGLEKLLLSRLSLLCAPSLFEGFTLHRLAAVPHALFYGWPLNADTGSRTLYRSYIAALRGGGMETFFASRPVLARLTAIATEFWISTTAGFVKRLAADLDAIRRSFSSGRPLGMVTHVRGELSDPHNGGQSVLQVTFASGLTIGYKPRDLGLDAAWRQMIRWLNSHGAPESAQAPQVLQRDGYGWVEWISSEPCPDPGGAARFFEQAGGMLCLLQFLRGIDFHSENVIANGDVPVPVDLETLVHPVIPDSWRTVDGETAAGRAARWLRDSVLAASYLPKWVAMPGGHSAAIGGLNPAELQHAKRWEFTAPNTDGMNYEPRKIPKAQAFHLPSISGKPLAPGAFHSEVETGYTVMYRFLMSRRHELLAADGPLEAFRGQTVRVLLRPTVLYALLLRKALEKRLLTSGVEWSLQFDFLARFSDFLESNANAERIRAAEQRALEQMDIPYFTGRTDSTDLRLPDGTVIEHFFAETSFGQLTRQAERMSEAALNEQLCLIRQALHSVNGGITSSRAPARSTTKRGKLTADRGIHIARSIAAALEKRAIRGWDGLTWIGGVPLPGENRAQLDIAGHDLYSGTAGIALFFSALHRLSGDAASREMALGTLAPLRCALKNSYRRLRLARVMGIGGGSGIGSLVYALTRSATLLADEALVDEAFAASELITDALIGADRSYDVLAGSAGAALGLLALHRERPNDCLLDRAIACGFHLAAHRRACALGGHAWRTLGKRELTGFSHGASGIALALLRLHHASGERRFLHAAQGALRYEDALFSEGAKNWPDLRQSASQATRTVYACQWCHGAPGIGLARIGALEVLDNACGRSYIEAAIGTTAEGPELAVDHLCCGNFGRLEVLLVAGRRLGRSDLVREAQCRADDLVTRAENGRGFRCSAGLDEFSPGFFTGLSGIGYELLRITHPEVLPSVLLWD